MGETKLLDEAELSYEGIFDPRELYGLLENFFSTKGYDKSEPSTRELVTKSGKDVQIDYEQSKRTNDYFKIVIAMTIEMRQLKDVELEIDKKKKKLKQGSLKIDFKVILKSDYAGRWDDMGWYYFIRKMFDMFIYKGFTKDVSKQAINDFTDLRKRIGGFLNMLHYTQK